MSLFQKKDKKKIEIEVRFYLTEDGPIVLEGEESCPEGSQEDSAKFFFKVPSWGEVRVIMSAGSSIRSDGAILDPHKFIDARIKTLLKDWTLEDGKGKKAIISESNIESLDPNVVDFINRQLEAHPEIKRAFVGKDAEQA